MKPLICWAIVSKDDCIDISSASYTRRSAIAKWSDMVQPWKYWRDKRGWRAAKVTISIADEAHARDAQMRAEGRVAGLREAAEIAGLNAWKHAGEDDYSRGMDAGAAHQVRACCDAIRAHADKIEGADNG